MEREPDDPFTFYVCNPDQARDLLGGAELDPARVAEYAAAYEALCYLGERHVVVG